MKSLIILLFILLTHSISAQTRLTDYEKGNIKNGYKEGVWEYYDKPGELALKINYDSSKLEYLKPDTADHVIKINDQWVKSKLDIQPRYIGSMNDFIKITSMIRYPAEARMNGTAGKFYIAFEIDTLGKAGNYEIINDIGSRCGKVAIDGLKALPNYWLTAQKDGKTYPAKFILPFTFKMILNGREINPRKGKKSEELPLAKELDEIVILAMGISR